MERLSFGTKNWMEYVDVEKLRQKIGDREVYLFSTRQQEYLIPFLKEHAIEVKGVFNETEQQLDKQKYLIIADRRNSDVMVKLREHELQEEEDYIYTSNWKIVSGVSGYYKDSCGNEIISDDGIEDINIIIEGYHNKLYIEKGVYLGKGTRIFLKGNAHVRFGENIYCTGGEMFFRNSNSEFGGDSYLANNVFISNFEGDMKIGKNFEALDSLYICVTEHTTLNIGSGCMTGKNVKILSGAAHSMFDLTRKENVNMKPNTHVTIGEHVWLGMGSSVMYTTELGDHCVVGADSLAKGIYPSHVAIAGNIAKVVRENVDWDREDYISYEQFAKEQEDR